MTSPAVVSALARSFLAGELSVDAVQARAARTLGQEWRFLRPLAERYVAAVGSEARVRPRHRDVVDFLYSDRGFREAMGRHRQKLHVAHWLVEPQRMRPVAAARAWGLPEIETAGDLADFLSLLPSELEWFADLKRLNPKAGSPQLQHYRYRVVAKRPGGFRLIESPKQNLRDIQRRVLDRVLNLVPAHPAAHGFVRGRSIVSFASPHAAQAALLRLDLANFFPAFPAARASAIFRTFGYPEPGADRLAALCTNCVPRSAWRERPPDVAPAEWFDHYALYSRPHLPQGAPTSPALANIAAFRLDCRLSALARAAGAVYTRYADDLAFSGPVSFARGASRFAARAAAIAVEEGFGMNYRKTKLMRPGRQQRLAGIVVNQAPSIPRRDLETLEAILTNCVRYGPESQNRAGHPDFRAHLEGRIGFVHMVSAAKAEPLRALFEKIAWV